MQAIITVKRITEYCSIVEMTQEKYDALQKAIEDGTLAEACAAEQELNKLIDTKDWQGDDFDSLESFEPYIGTP